MFRVLAKVTATAALLLTASLAAQAASFDCAKATTADENAICDDPALSALDSEMGGLWYAYSRFPFLMGASGTRHDEAEAFLKRRAACGSDVSCLRDAYEERITVLREQIAKAMKDVEEAEFAPPPSSTLPAPVAAIADDYGAQCTRLDGTLENPDALTVMAADLDGDGQLDYLLDAEALRCSTAATAYCGNGGCQISIALSHDDYANPVDVLGVQPALIRNEKGVRADVWVDNTNCPDRAEDETCWAVYSWVDGVLDKKYEARPGAD